MRTINPIIQAHPSEYHIWGNMRYRCRNKNAPDYDRYGGRGISVCERWDSFESFLADMGPRPSPLHSIDRRDNDLGYSPENCAWATTAEQVRNRRNTVRLTKDGQTKCGADWATQIGVSESTIYYRVKRGESPEEALRPKTWQRKSRAAGSTGYRGAYPTVRGGKFFSRMTIKGKNVYLGVFDTAEEAARAYDQKALEVHGPTAKLNFSILSKAA